MSPLQTAARPGHVFIRDGAARRAGVWLTERYGPMMHFIIADGATWAVAGADLAAALNEAGATTRVMILEPAPDTGQLTCEAGVVASLATFLRVSRNINVVAVGAGTIADVVKLAAHAAARPHQLLLTAPTVGVCDPMGWQSATQWDGGTGDAPGKRNARPPEAVFADPQTLADAPSALTIAALSAATADPELLVAASDLARAHAPTPTAIAQFSERALTTRDAAAVAAARGVAGRLQRGEGPSHRWGSLVGLGALALSRQQGQRGQEEAVWSVLDRIDGTPSALGISDDTLAAACREATG